VRGSRELQLDDAWREELEWLERDGLRRRGHHPDLAGALAPGGRWLPIEVELAHKSTNRLRSILALHASWIAAQKTDAVMYVCVSEAMAERVLRHARELGLSIEGRTLRVDTIATIRQAAVRPANRPARQTIGATQAA
jgi:hypothetical protein